MRRAGADAGWGPARSAAGNRNPWLIAAIISIATFMEVLDTSIANVRCATSQGRSPPVRTKAHGS
jgi:DHA2 family multidrug resistance protein